MTVVAQDALAELDSIAKMDARYGRSVHNDKSQLIRTRNDGVFKGRDGKKIDSCYSIKYLGCDLRADGQIRMELSQKLGRAWAGFYSLCHRWKHSSG